MSTFVLLSAVLVSLALLFYSIGVWAERLSRFLRSWHVAMFWTGFVFDVSGTLAMHFISDKPFDLTNLHTLTGQIALWLMLLHAIWATTVILKKKSAMRNVFHRFSLIVWLIWLVPYIGGMLIGMGVATF